MRILQGMRDALLKEPYNRIFLTAFFTLLMIETLM